MCSDTFNIDKTAPIVGNLILNGNKGFDDWYIGNVSIDKEDSTDALSGIDSDIISANYSSPEIATFAIQNKILNDEISGILEFSIKTPERFYIWFNDYDLNNLGSVTFRLYKGKVDAKSILREFLGEDVSLPYSTHELSTEIQVLSKKEANKYLKSIFNTENTNDSSLTKTKQKKKAYQYYIEKINELIKVLEISYDEEQIITENIIGGPFFSIDTAKEFINNYCEINNLDYEELNDNKQYTVVIGER